MKKNDPSSQSAKKREEKKMYSIRVWDIPTRWFHWLLVGFVVFSFITTKIGLSAMKYHQWSGFAILVLVLFRLVWGFIGGRQSRFSAFVKGPAAVIRYASTLFSKESNQYIGHNPLGGWSIIAMLLSLLTQVGTGLFAGDGIFIQGPLYDLVSRNTSSWLTGIHHLNQKVLIVLVAIHIAAILFHLIVKRENLIVPMITGKKIWEQKIDSSWGNPLIALLLAAVVAVVAYGVVY